MRLATISTPSGPRAAIQTPSGFIDLHATEPSLPTNLRELLEGGSTLLGTAASMVDHHKPVIYAADKVTLLAPIVDPQKIICVGLNYRDHAIESGAAIPRDPVLFSKYVTTLVGTGANIVLPSVSQEVDYEAELVIVIGKRGRHLRVDEAMNYVVGYTIGHDVSARDWQLQKDGKQWMVGKTFDTFAPLGPVLVTCDEIRDPCDLGIRLRLNGQTMQDSSTKQLIFSPAAIITYLSQVMTLVPGDLIFTGTPPGVGMARKPPVYLKPGDVVEVEIDGLGVLSNPVVADSAQIV
jgi:2-keto-4-pentenoate hydratase/2-oxohepta-3-ene-1,7-dioic acid hydratase in catechol pathway